MSLSFAIACFSSFSALLTSTQWRLIRKASCQRAVWHVRLSVVFWRQLVRKDPIFDPRNPVRTGCVAIRRNGEAENVVCVPFKICVAPRQDLCRTSSRDSVIVFACVPAKRAWLDLLGRLMFNLVKSARFWLSLLHSLLVTQRHLSASTQLCSHLMLLFVERFQPFESVAFSPFFFCCCCGVSFPFPSVVLRSRGRFLFSCCR